VTSKSAINGKGEGVFPYLPMERERREIKKNLERGKGRYGFGGVQGGRVAFLSAYFFPGGKKKDTGKKGEGMYPLTISPSVNLGDTTRGSDPQPNTLLKYMNGKDY